MVIQLLAGMFLGSVVTSLIWGVVLNTLKKRSEKNSSERDAIMHSLGELWVEIEGLLSSSRMGGGRSEQELRERYTARLNEVKRLLRPNLHLFESYYVKYNEQLVAHYSRKVFGSDIDAAVATEAVTDHEVETGLGFAEPPVGASLSKKDEAIEQPAEVSDNTVVETPPPGAEIAAPEDFQKVSDKKEPTEADVAPKKSFTAIQEDETVDVDREVTTETVMFKPSVDPEDTDVAGKDKLFNEAKSAAEAKTEALEVVIAPEKLAADQQVPKEPEQTASSDDEEEAVFEPKLAPVDEDISATVSAVSEGSERMFNEEEFTMETMVDVDINSLSSFLKKQPGKDTDSSGKTQKSPAASPEAVKPEKESDGPDLEVVVASDATHSALPAVEEEKVAKGLPEEPVVEVPTEKPKAEKNGGGDAIPEETVYARTEDIEKKKAEEKVKEKPKANISVRDDFDMMFQEGPVAVKPSSESTEQKQPASTGEKGEELFEASLTDADSEMVTGNDVADKIAALEGIDDSPKQKKQPNGSAKKAKNAVSVEKKSPPPSSSQSKVTADSVKGKNSPVTAKRSARGDDSITGNDVADKIDAFFGLFDD